MKTFKLIRYSTSEMGTFGRLYDNNDIFFCYTLEKEWLNNIKSKSCIPVGTYELKHRPYYRGGYNALEVLNVPNREHILIHAGNTEDDVIGCIAVGSKIGCLNNKWAVLDSRNTLNILLSKINDGDKLEISWIKF